MKVLLALALVAAFWTGSVPLFILAAVALSIQVGVGYWERRVSGTLSASRHFERRIFFGESLPVTVRVRNGSALPVPWLEVREQAPYTLAGPNVLSQVIGLGARETRELTYHLRGLQRGYQAIGPLRLNLGHVFGFEPRELEVPGRQHLLVYPQLLPYQSLELPSLALLGDRRTRRYILGDPSRVIGVRDYAPGDPYRDIHWRATATAGSLQVKLYQPTTILHAMIVLDHRSSAYPIRRASGAELAISVAASVAACLVERGQEVGLVTNGLVRLAPDDSPIGSPVKPDALMAASSLWPLEARVVPPTPMPPAKSRAHLLQILEILACLKLHDSAEALTTLVLRQGEDMPWGSTIVVITGDPADALFLALHRVRERGIVVVLYIAGLQPAADALRARGRALGVQVRIVSERYLEEVAL
jgi:uncharacterized protein (DUF58 family)